MSSPVSPKSTSARWSFSKASTLNARSPTLPVHEKDPSQSQAQPPVTKPSWRQTLAAWHLCSAPQSPEDVERAKEAAELQQEEDRIDEENITRIKLHTLEEGQEGYPRLAAFLSSEPGFSMYRGFAYAHSRVLLDLQCEINDLEAELERVDLYDAEKAARDRRKSPLVSRRLDVANYEAQSQAEQERQRCESEEVEEAGTANGSEGSENDEDEDEDDDDLKPRSRREILDELHQKLLAYDELLVKAREVGGFQKPSDRDFRNMRVYMNNKKPLVPLEMRYIERKEDFVSLRHGREWSGFDGFVENVLRKFNCKILQHLFTTPETRAKTDDPDIHFYSAVCVEKFCCLLITLVIFTLLILPVVAMYTLMDRQHEGNDHASFDRVGVLIVFTLVFAAIMSVCTKALRHEIFAASAAYCAVLVVFISNFDDH